MIKLFIILDLNRYIKTYNIDENIVLNTPNFTFIDSLLSTISRTNKSKSSVRQYTRWFMRTISLNQYKEIAQYDLNKNQFILHSEINNSYNINPITGQLILLNNRQLDFLDTEISIHTQSGLSKGDDILHDIYRFIRLSTGSSKLSSFITLHCVFFS